MNYNTQTAVLSLSLHYDHQSRLIVISLDTWRGSDAIKQLSVNTLICVHNALGDTAGNVFVHKSTQEKSLILKYS